MSKKLEKKDGANATSQAGAPNNEVETHTTNGVPKRRNVMENDNIRLKEIKQKKKIFKVGTWNVRTLQRPGKMNEVANEVIRYGIDVAALQELRRRGCGEIKQGRYTLFFSGESTQGRNGVGFVVNNKIVQNVLTFRAVSGRTAYLRIHSKTNISIVNGYAPTEDTNDSEKDAFYNEIESLCDTIFKQYVLIILGDFNAKI